MLGCSSSAPKRPAMSEAELLAARADAREAQIAQSDVLFTGLIERLKAEQDAHQAGETDTPPVLDVLVISGGGDWGAYGAGFLRGWGQVTGEMARPQFEVVTGVSTGALIAPFAFVGTDEAYDHIVDFYRNPQETWVSYRGTFYFMPGNPSFTTIPGLEQEMEEAIDQAMVERLIDAHSAGRILAVNATNLDLGQPRAFDVLAAAREAAQTGDFTRIHQILLASSAIPGAFPPRQIDGWLYVDGAVTGNILYGGRQSEGAGVPARWRRTYPETPMPKLRYWVIFNNQITYPPQVTDERWPDIVQRSTWMSNQTATVESIRRLFDRVAIDRLRYDADIEVRYTAVPNDWTAPKPGTFIPETMNNLADIGEQRGADPASWHDTMP